MIAQPLVDYRITYKTPRHGELNVEVTTTEGAEIAARRGRWTLSSQGYGARDDIRPINVDVLCGWLSSCTNAATDAIEHPVIGSVPTCTVCAAGAQGAKPR